MEGPSQPPSRPTPPKPPTPPGADRRPPRPPVPPRPPQPPKRSAAPPTPPASKKAITVADEAISAETLGVPTPQQEVTALLKSEKVQIRTMQDDLAAARQQPPQPAPAIPSTPAVKAPIQGITTKPLSTVSPTAADTAAPEPLPPSKLQQPGKVVMAPPKKVRRKRSLVRTLVLILGIVLLGSGVTIGWLAWEGSVPLPTWLSFTDTPAEDATVITDAADVLPGQTALIVQYQLTSAADRSAVLQAWDKSATPPTLETLLEGDPRVLLGEPNTEVIYYVVLEGDTRPYLATRKTPQLEGLFSALPETQLEEIKGWYIAHSLDVTPYRAALDTATLASVGGNDILVSTASDVPFRYILGPSALIRLREHVGGAPLALGLLQEVGIAGRLVAQDSALDVAGVGKLLTVPTTSPNQLQPAHADQQLLSYIPETATAVMVGAAFHAELDTLAEHSTVIDHQALEQASVHALLDSLAGPYAFYIETTPGGRHDYGLVITLPPELQGTLQVPDATVEAGLSALLPLVTGRAGIAPIAFNNNTYNGIPLRYANFSEPSQALDYAVTDQHLLITTSRESMFHLLDAYTGTMPSVANSVSWANLLATWGAIPAGPTLFLSQATDPFLTSFLPGGGAQPFSFGISLLPAEAGSTEQAVQGVVVFPAVTPIATQQPGQ